MFIARTDKFKYLGYKDNYYQFKDEKNNSLTLVPQAKLIDVENDIVFVLKENGTIEPSYASIRANSKEKIRKSFKTLFTEKGIPGQLVFDENGNITEE